MHRPLVSVILPTYNRERLLRESVASVLAQTYDNLELIVVDDGSTDGTREYLGTLDDSRIRSIYTTHSGNSAAVRNVGISQARGEFVAFQDSDDLWLPTKIERQIEQLRRHPECAWSYHDTEYIDDEGLPIALHRAPWKAYDGWILEDLLELRVGIPLPSVVVARDVLATVGGFNESLPRRHDIELWIRIAERAQATVVPEKLMHVRRHAGNVVDLRLDEQRYMDATFAALVARTTSPHIRRIARRRRALMSLFFVDQFRWANQYREARQILRESFAYAWREPAWWGALAKTLVRPLLPETTRSKLLERARVTASPRTADRFPARRE